MDEQELRNMLDMACKLGDAHSLRAIEYANQARLLRIALWRALGQLRAGQTAAARKTLERALAKDQ
jgi:Tfp pilus assembly protein PilF